MNPTQGKYIIYNTIGKKLVSNESTKLYHFSEDLNSIKVGSGYNLDDLSKLIINKKTEEGKEGKEVKSTYRTLSNGKKVRTVSKDNQTLYVNDRLRTEGTGLYLGAIEGEGWYNLPIILTVSPDGIETSLMGNIHRISDTEVKEIDIDNKQSEVDLELLFNYLDSVMGNLQEELLYIYNKLGSGMLK